MGKLLEGKTPKEVAKLRILDPACGSGSFLVGAYQHLIEWHRDWYLNDGAEKHPREIYQGAGGQWYLATGLKRKILLANIYGVDIDAQAVEVTKLALLLKVLEDENQETLEKQRKLFNERALPDLGSNIKCGNSLIGPDFYKKIQRVLFDDDTREKVNVFDWEAEFSKIMSNGGFQVVIGNPPYLYSAGQEYPEYFLKKFKLAQYQADFYQYFIEQSLELANRTGTVSFIVSDSWLKAENFSKLRQHILTTHCLKLVTVFDYPVFEQATLENSIFCVNKGKKKAPITIERFVTKSKCLVVNTINPKDAVIAGMIDPHKSAKAERVIAKMELNSKQLKADVKFNRGIHAYRTDGYGQSKFKRGYQIERDKEEESYHALDRIDNTLPSIGSGCQTCCWFN